MAAAQLKAVLEAKGVGEVFGDARSNLAVGIGDAAGVVVGFTAIRAVGEALERIEIARESVTFLALAAGRINAAGLPRGAAHLVLAMARLALGIGLTPTSGGHKGTVGLASRLLDGLLLVLRVAGNARFGGLEAGIEIGEQVRVPALDTFATVKYAGVAYLLYLAWGMWRETGSFALDAPQASAEVRAIVTRGFLINILNPKLSIFFLAFLPQFVDAGAPSALGDMLFLSAVFMLMTLAVFIVYGLCAHAVRARFVDSPGRLLWLRRGFAGLFALLGARLAAAEK